MKTYPSRPRLSLDGDFRFTFDPDDRGIREQWFERTDVPSVRIQVPGAWQAVLHTHEPVGWYWKRFSVPPTMKDSLLFLSFGAVDSVCEVWVNGRWVGRHYGGYTPFDFDISSAVRRKGSNLLAVRVVDAAAGEPRHPEIPPDILRGAQSAHWEVSGIWQSVHLESRSSLSLGKLEHRTEIDPPAMHAVCELVLPELRGQPLQVVARILTRDGTLIGQQEIAWEESVGNSVELSLHPEKSEIIPWSPSQPELYLFEVEALLNEKTHDSVRIRTGFRAIEALSSNLVLNHEPLYVRGVLDPGLYSGGICPLDEPSAIREAVDRYRSMGFNLVRTHRQPFPPAALDACDEVGLLVWEETPLANGTPWEISNGEGEAGTNALQEIEALVRRDCHHPSLVIWGITSENLQSTTVRGGQWMHHLCKRIRELHPDVLLVENSDPFHYGAGTARSDILDFHAYRDILARKPTAGPSTAAPPTISALNSEFGAWGFPAPEGLGQGGEYADLFSRLRKQFDQLGLGDSFPSVEDFCLDTQTQQYQAIRRQIEDFRVNLKVTGHVLNGAYDCSGRCTGIADPLRRPRTFSSKMCSLNSGLLPIVKSPTRNFWSGAEIEIRPVLANQTGKDTENWKLSYRAGRSGLVLARGTCAGGTIPYQECVETEPIEIPLPDLENVTAFKLILTLEADSHRSVETDWVFWAYPPIDMLPSCPVSVNVNGSWPQLWDILPRLEAASLDLCDVLLATAWDGTVEDCLKNGGVVVLIVDRFDLGKVGSRADMCKPFKTSFVRWNHPIFAEFPHCRRMDMRFQALAPVHLITGVQRPIVGYFREWDYIGAAMAEFSVAKGRLLVTTLNFERLAEDPMTAHLLHAMIQYAASEEFQPTEQLFL